MRRAENKFLFFPLSSGVAFSLLIQCESGPKITKLLSQSQREIKIAEFGKQLFFDKSLSIDSSISCASCHKPELAFTDGEVLSKGVFGSSALRNSPSLFNVKDVPHFMFDAAVSTLEMQAIIPIQDENEMGFNMGSLIKRLKHNQGYVSKAKKLFNRDLDAFVLTRSLAKFQRTLVSKNSAFDTYLNSNFKEGLNKTEIAGWKLFTEQYDCISCHRLPNLTTYNLEINHLTNVTQRDQGRYRITGDSMDIGRFKIPSLRNIALTAPYMHDGSLNTLEAVIEAYSLNREKFSNKKMQSFVPTPIERAALLAFLRSLTDKNIQNQ